MNKLCCLIVMFFTCGVCEAQNLVPNGDFEQYSGCPSNYNQIDFALFWFNPCIPPYGTAFGQSGSSDYFNACASIWQIDVPNNFDGYQPAHSGNGYAGLIPF